MIVTTFAVQWHVISLVYVLYAEITLVRLCLSRFCLMTNVAEKISIHV